MPTGHYIRSEEHLKKMRERSKLRIGILRSDEVRRKVSNKLMGHLVSEESRNKMRESHLGKTLSQEQRDKISLAHKGREWSPEHIEAHRKAHVGIPRSAETKERIRLAQKGKPKLHQRGANCCRWRGGITEKNYNLRTAIQTTFEYKQWRSAVYHKDNFTCQDCGDNRGGNLNAHHNIKSFQQIIDQYKIMTIEQSRQCEELWDIFNGITLCKSCHINRHRNVDWVLK